jgi:hypothetical protein
MWEVQVHIAPEVKNLTYKIFETKELKQRD